MTTRRVRRSRRFTTAISGPRAVARRAREETPGDRTPIDTIGLFVALTVAVVLAGLELAL